MSNPITAARQQLAKALQVQGWSSYPDLPESASAPGVVVGIASPYLQQPDTLGGSWWLRQNVYLLASTQTNESARADLDQMIAATVAAVEGTDWCLDADESGGVEAPLLLTVGSDTFTAARVPVAVQIDLTQEGA